MPYSYQSSVDGGPFEDLADFASMVRIVNEGRSGRDVAAVLSPFVPGAVPSLHQPYIEKLLFVECQIRWTDPSGLITHVDGAEGHASENLSHLDRLLGGGYGPATLRRDWPNQGVVERPITGAGDPFPTQNRATLSWPVRSTWPAWKSTAALSSSSGNPDVLGHFPIYDPIITFVGGTDVSVTVNGRQVGIAGAVPGAGVIVNVGTGQVTQVTGGADYSAFLTADNNEWCVLYRGVNTVVYAGGGTYTIEWAEQWP